MASMVCPKCGAVKSIIKDSQLRRSMNTVRRRHECGGCKHRFTTYERIQGVSGFPLREENLVVALQRARTYTTVEEFVTALFDYVVVGEDI